ncbi:MAG: hypothetical protein WBZ48_08380 [Bacteroidota bacterium]
MEPTLFTQTRCVSALLFLSASIALSQDVNSRISEFSFSSGINSQIPPDSNIVFESPNKEEITPQQTAYLADAGGIDILLSNSGFGLGGFYRHQYTEDLFGTMSIGFSEVSDPNEVQYVEYDGETVVPGKINRFLLIPLHVGVQYRLFADEILDNFRPYVNAAVGPTMVFTTPYSREFFNSIGHGQAHYTAGGFVGLGAFFGSDRGTLSGINIRYYFEYIRRGIDSMQNDDGSIEKMTDFGGFFITLNLGEVF